MAELGRHESELPERAHATMSSPHAKMRGWWVNNTRISVPNPETVAMRRQILEELDELERRRPGSTAIWSPWDGGPDYDLRVRETQYLLDSGYIKGGIGGDHWIQARIVAAGRDYLETLRSTAMATVAKFTIPAPAQLPAEWKELARGTAAKHDWNAEPHLTDEGIYLVLTTYKDGPDVEANAAQVCAEIERALTQPSRVRNDASMQNVFINNGQAGAMGPNAVASGNTFQQQINMQPLVGAEQQRVIEQLERLMNALHPTATDPDHFMALAEVKRAQLEAKTGNRNGVVAALKKAGKWVYEVAEKIGVEVVGSLIKDAM